MASGDGDELDRADGRPASLLTRGAHPAGLLVSRAVRWIGCSDGAACVLDDASRSTPDRRTSASFDRLLEQALANGPDEPIDYRLEAPKWQFLCHTADRGRLLLHGSGDPAISRFEPRQPDDSSEFGNRRAVFAAGDGLWPMYYAILDRDRHPMSLINGCARLANGSERLGEPHYYLSISAQALKQQPWRPGTVYLLPAGTFELQPRMRVGDVSVQPAQWASPVPVTPVAKLAVLPEDFPFLDQIRGHDDERVWTRAAADPYGFPWHAEA